MAVDGKLSLPEITVHGTAGANPKHTLLPSSSQMSEWVIRCIEPICAGSDLRAFLST
jgi:hypothetical protein